MVPSSSSVQDLPLPPEPLPPPAAPLLPPAAWPPSLPLGALGLARLPRRRDGATLTLTLILTLTLTLKLNLTLTLTPTLTLALTLTLIRRDGATVDWAYGLRCAWAVGEDGAQAALAALNPNLKPYPHPQAYPYPKPYPKPDPYPYPSP